MPGQPPPPTVGRIVHYVSLGSADGQFAPEHRAAIIAAVVDSVTADLVVFNPQGIFFNRVDYSEGLTPGTWHWPERTG